jgi:hypothetical protein
MVDHCPRPVSSTDTPLTQATANEKASVILPGLFCWLEPVDHRLMWREEKR